MPSSAAPEAAAIPHVTVEQGILRGSVDGSVRAFKGIPYAAPPVGALRWKAPASPVKWDGERDATVYGAICPQPRNGDVGAETVGAEDCLFLNVWAPAHGSESLPVMVFFHGGADYWGGSSRPDGGDSEIAGQQLAERGPAIVVTINYRVGVLGFFAHPALAAENEHKVEGNYGLLDQIAALQWVKRNISVFGGDPSRVMMFGQSAGSYDAFVLLASPLARGLFSRVLLESTVTNGTNREMCETQSTLAAKQVGCGGSDPVACMRGKAVDDLIQHLPRQYDRNDAGFGFPIVLDGWLLPDRPLNIVRRGEHNHVPVVLGSTADEYSTLIKHRPPKSKLTTQAELEDEIRLRFPKLAKGIIAEYPSSEYPSPREAYITLRTDSSQICPLRQAAQALVAGQSEPVFRYIFTHKRDAGPQKALGAGHAMEIPFVFRSFKPSENGYTTAEVALSDVISGYWTRFAAAGDPNGEGVAWPRYDPKTDSYLALDETTRVDTGFHTHHCDFWDKSTGEPAPSD